AGLAGVAPSRTVRPRGWYRRASPIRLRRAPDAPSPSGCVTRPGWARLIDCPVGGSSRRGTTQPAEPWVPPAGPSTGPEPPAVTLGVPVAGAGTPSVRPFGSSMKAGVPDGTRPRRLAAAARLVADSNP